MLESTLFAVHGAIVTPDHRAREALPGRAVRVPVARAAR
jgi:hypothetical protein